MKEQKLQVIQVVELPEEPGLANLRVVRFESSKLPNHVTFEVGKTLSPAELRKSSKFRFQRDRLLYLNGRGVLRRLGSEMLKVPANDLVILEGQYGKPYFQNAERVLPFNLSNSGDHVSIVFDFSNRLVGLDIEVIDNSYEYWDVAGAFFTKKECDCIYSHRDFYRMWTMKEALLKVTGVGLVDDLQLIDLSSPLNQVSVSDERLEPFRNQSFTLYTFDDEELAYTVAVEGTYPPGPPSELGKQVRLSVRSVLFA